MYPQYRKAGTWQLLDCETPVRGGFVNEEQMQNRIMSGVDAETKAEVTRSNTR
jgi:hypothetical protein